MTVSRKLFEVGLTCGGPSRGATPAQAAYKKLLRKIEKESKKVTYSPEKVPGKGPGKGPAKKSRVKPVKAAGPEKYVKPASKTGEIGRLGRRMRLWLETFAKRSDLDFHAFKVHPGVKPKPAVKSFSSGLHALLRELNGYDLTWSRKGSDTHHTSGVSSVGDDGSLRLTRYEEGSYPFDQESVAPFEYSEEVEEYLCLDVASAELAYYLVRMPRKTGAGSGHMVCSDANYCVVARMNELHLELCRAAKSAFIYYWHAPTKETRSELKALKDASAPLRKVAEKRAADGQGALAGGGGRTHRLARRQRAAPRGVELQFLRACPKVPCSGPIPSP